jgi:hypothetical protein
MNNFREILHPYISYTNSMLSLLSSREGDPKGWSTMIVTALGSWEKTVPRGQLSGILIIIINLLMSAPMIGYSAVLP